jgi:hypothetical protein
MTDPDSERTIFKDILSNLPALPLGIEGATRAMAATIARLYAERPAEARELERQLMALAFAIENAAHTEQHKAKGFYQGSEDE